MTTPRILVGVSSCDERLTVAIVELPRRGDKLVSLRIADAHGNSRMIRLGPANTARVWAALGHALDELERDSEQ